MPLLKSEIADKRAWADFDEICDYYALSQSLPGLVAANVSIFTGCKLNGQKGALAALAGITAPSFLAIILIASILEELIRNNIVQYIFAGVGVGVVVLLILAVKEMWARSIVDKFTRVVFLTAFLLAVFKISPVIIILGSIFAGYVYFQLLYEFFKTGLFSFGGGYATLPFLYGMSENYHWFSAKQLTDIIAVSSITPGPLGVNAATYAGFVTSGITGAFAATAAVVFPSYIVVIIVSRLLDKFKENRHVQSAIYALKPAGCGLLAAVAACIFKANILNIWMLILFAVLLVLSFKLKRDPLLYLGISAAAGLIAGLLKFI